jgi:SHS2 domain-containing protein
MPYEELSHSADWALHAWAADLDLLFEECAKGMNALSGTRLAESPRLRRRLSLSAGDVESLLVSFLSEIVFCAEYETMAFDDFQLRIAPGKDKTRYLNASMEGAPILSMDKAIKAVTFHNLHIIQTGRGFEVEIVFDV